MEKITILIADDHKLIRDTWSFILDRDPRLSVVAVAESGNTAIEQAKITRPDIVLMDINMDDIDGFEATKQIKKISPGSKVIGVSMHSMPAYAKKMLKMGASGYVTKNSSTDELFTAIIEVFNKKTYICEEVKNILTQLQLQTEDSKPDINLLSKRELEVVLFIKSGLSSKEISSQMGVSMKTVEVHRYNILKKLSLPNTASLVNFANGHGL